MLEKVTGLEKDMIDFKADLRRLHRDDNFIIDEVERVHEILDKHKEDRSVHTAYGITKIIYVNMSCKWSVKFIELLWLYTFYFGLETPNIWTKLKNRMEIADRKYKMGMDF